MVPNSELSNFKNILVYKINFGLTKRQFFFFFSVRKDLLNYVEEGFSKHIFLIEFNMD